MKIAIDARTMGSRPSGIGMYLFDFLKELIKYEDLQVILISDVATSEHMKYFANKGIEIRQLGEIIYRSRNVYQYFDFVQKQLDEIKPDVFWEVNSVVPVKLKGNQKNVITIHDMFPITHVKYYGNVYKMYFKYGIGRSLKQIDGIIYNSIQSKITTEAIFKKAREIPNVNGYIIVKQLKHKPEIKDDNFFFYLGNMEMRKGVDVLLEGYRKYRNMGGTKPLIIAGKMQEEVIKQLLTKAMDEVEGITYLDYVTEEKTRELFATCSAFVFPSRAEGFGMPVIEAMEYHKPVIASDLDIYKEVVDNVIETFDMEGVKEVDRCAQNLANAMLNSKLEVDSSKYDEICNRYSASILGKRVYDFLMEVAGQ